MSVFRRRMRLRLAPGSATLPSLGVGEGGNGLYQPAAGTVAELPVTVGDTVSHIGR